MAEKEIFSEQEYKRRSVLRDSQTETDSSLLRAASAVSVASGATDRSGNTDNCVEEFVCDVPFAGTFRFQHDHLFQLRCFCSYLIILDNISCRHLLLRLVRRIGIALSIFLRRRVVSNESDNLFYLLKILAVPCLQKSLRIRLSRKLSKQQLVNKINKISK